MRWRDSALVREALQNVRSNAFKTATLSLVTFAVTGGLAYSELDQAASIARFSKEFEDAGGYVAIVSSPGGIDAGICNALNDHPAVVHAGSFRATGTIGVQSVPSELFQSAEISGEIASLWSGATALDEHYSNQGTVVVGHAFASEVGVRRGSYLGLAGSDALAVGAVIPPQPRNPRVQRMLLIPGPPNGTTDECWVEFSKGSFAAGMEMLRAMSATGDREPGTHRLLGPDLFTRDVNAEFRQRNQRFAWVPAGVLISIFFLAVAWFRRAELALYLAVGTGRTQLLSLLLMEFSVPVFLGSLYGEMAALVMIRLTELHVPWDHQLLAIRTSASAALLALFLGPLLAMLAARGNVAAMLKDR